MTLDALRAALPDCGFVVSAYEPGGDVTLEVIATDGETFQFVGPTEAAVIARAFPGASQPEPAAPPAESATASVFD